jgi:hypothetical protein
VCDAVCRLELVTAVGCVVMSVLACLPTSGSDVTWIRYMAAVRLLRLASAWPAVQLPNMFPFLYIFVQVKQIRIFYETFLSMLPAAVRLMQVRRFNPGHALPDLGNRCAYATFMLHRHQIDILKRGWLWLGCAVFQ